MTENYDTRHVQAFHYPPRGLSALPLCSTACSPPELEDVVDQVERTCRSLPDGDYLVVRTYVEDDGSLNQNALVATVSHGAVLRSTPY